MHGKKIMGLIALFVMIGNWGECSEPNVFSLDEVVVTATKTPMPVKMISADVSIITADEIAARNAHSLKDIIDSLPGVAINRGGGRRALNIRGFDSRYAMILIDGRRIPAEPDGNYELDRLSLHNVERIEVLRGSASGIYGADSLGGVVNLISKKEKKREFTVKSDGTLWGNSSDAEKNFSLSYNSGNQGKWNMSFAADQNKNDAFLKSNGTTYYPFGTRSYINAQVFYHPNSMETWSMGASCLKEQTNEYGIMSGMMGNTISTDLYDDNRRQLYHLDYRKKQDNYDLFIDVFHSIWEKNNDTMNRNNRQYTNAVYGYTTISGMEAKMTRSMSAKHKMTVGGEYRTELFKGTGIQSGEGIFTVGLKGKNYAGSEVRTDYGAFYIQDEWTISPQWLLISSLRWDGSSRFENNLSPKLGITYAPKSDLRYKINVGTGFRVPSPNQLFLNLNVIRNSRLVSITGNPFLHPEKSRYFDVSIEKDWGTTTNGKITLFSSHIKEMIDEVWTTPNQIQYQNVGRAKIQGIEVSFSHNIDALLKWTGNYTYLDAVNTNTQERLLNRPRHKISSQWTYQASKNLKVNCWMDVYNGYRCQPSAYEIADKTYVTWNVSFEKEISKDQSLIVSVENIFNRKEELLNIPGTMFKIGYKVNL